jgi:homoserine kinase
VLEGLRTGDPDGLKYSEDDRRHQPYRLAAMHTSQAIFDILVETPEVAGAFLSGAGTTVAGWIVGAAEPVEAVARRLAQQNIQAEVRLARPDFNGVVGTKRG